MTINGFGVSANAGGDRHAGNPDKFSISANCVSIDESTKPGSPVSGLLVLDTSYTFEIIRERGLEASVTCRDLDGYFKHVWSVHPFATLVTSQSWTPKFGKPVWHEINPRHTFIEAKVGRYGWLRGVFVLNFLLSQAGLFLMLLRLIRTKKIKLIRAGDPLYLGLFGWVLARLSGIPLAIRVNGNNDRIRESTGKPIFQKLFRNTAIEKTAERFIFKRAELVAAPNQDNVDFALANGANPDRVTIFRYGNVIAGEHLLDPAQRTFELSVLKKLGVEKKKYLLCIGRLEPVKFPDDTVRILGEMHRRGFDLQLVLAGDGQMRADLEELAAELGVGDRIVFAGNQNQVQLAELIPNAAAIISPLTGRSLTEAAFGAAPIVAYDLDWQSDVIETGVTGELAPFREWKQLAEGIERFLKDPAYAEAMGQGARIRAMDMLDPDKLNEHERNQYTAILKRHSPRSRPHVDEK